MAVPEPPYSDRWRFPSRCQLQMIHSQFTFFVCKPKFLFSLNSSWPFLVSSLSWLQSDSSNTTTPAATLAISAILNSFGTHLLANFSQCWQGSSGEKYRQSLHMEWWFLTEYEIETQHNTITGVKAVNSALLHNQGQQTVGWLCISLFSHSWETWEKAWDKMLARRIRACWSIQDGWIQQFRP